MEDIEYIKRFSKITIKSCCEKVGVDPCNLFKDKVSKEKKALVKKEIENRIARLYIIDEKDNTL